MEAVSKIQNGLTWAVASAPMKGFATSGDSYLVHTFQGGALVAGIDGLGHGEEAAEAARLAVDAILEAPTDPVMMILKRCHDRLVGKPRGVVMTLACFNKRERTVTCAGVGNVEAMLFRADPQSVPPHESLILRRGVIGARIPSLHASILSVNPGDTLILLTDGIRRGFEAGLRLGDSPHEIADSILAKHASGGDDALVLVVRCGEL